jgi:hypothetical protein
VNSTGGVCWGICYGSRNDDASDSDTLACCVIFLKAQRRTKACVMEGGTLGSVASVVAERLIDKDSLVGGECVVDKGVS